MADRDADIFELFAPPRALNSHRLIRVKTNRRIQQEWGKLFTALAQAPVMGELTVEVKRTPDRPARLAQVQLRTLQVTLEVPEHLARQRPDLQPMTLNALWVEEIGTPRDGGKPICWKLLTTLPLETYAQACQYVRWYSYRWLIVGAAFPKGTVSLHPQKWVSGRSVAIATPGPTAEDFSHLQYCGLATDDHDLSRSSDP